MQKISGGRLYGFAGARNEGAAGLKELKEKYGDLLVPLQLDVADTKSVESAAEAACAYTDHLDVIINNAGIHSETSFLELEDADLDDCLPVYDVNAVGPVRVVKAFLPLLKRESPAWWSISHRRAEVSAPRKE